MPKGALGVVERFTRQSPTPLNHSNHDLATITQQNRESMSIFVISDPVILAS